MPAIDGQMIIGLLAVIMFLAVAIDVIKTINRMFK